mgnify:CR=1 FL=1
MGLLYLRGKMPKPQPIQISIPNPCTEDWSKMTPAEQGRFCSSCQKCVVDFRGFSDRQLYEYMQAYKTQQVCGRFYDTQLNRTIHIPPQPHSALYRHFIGLGLTLILAQIPVEEAKAKAPYSFTSIINNNSIQEENTNGDSITIKGRVLDDKREPLLGALVELYNGENKLKGDVANEDGYFSITIDTVHKNKDLKLIIRYTTFTTKTIICSKDSLQEYNNISMELDENVMTMGIITIDYKVPLLLEGNTRIITSEEIEKGAY